ncbi:BA75_02996T0 [Komagataella pastoris]|uniref:Pre-mRNA-processing factor 17 n=1 Tax=Komagataella pastoris TaxID=4922 RepID=A0A1B2JC55_PICPA|nr:BA75_02996T0 [Komagataella pastoris]
MDIGYSSEDSHDGPEESKTEIIIPKDVITDVLADLDEPSTAVAVSTVKPLYEVPEETNRKFNPFQREAVDAVTFKLQKRAFDRHMDSSNGGENKKQKSASKGSITVVEGPDRYRGSWGSSSDESDPYSYSEPEEIDSKRDYEKTVQLTAKPMEDESSVVYSKEPFMQIPKSVGIDLTKESGTRECFVPKRRIFQWEGHKRGTNKLQFFPNSGHLLLSGGNDSSVLLWDVYHDRSLLQGYHGHTKPVKDISFNNDGTQFISCSYDKTVKLWDTETGKCTNRIKLTSFPNVAKLNPNSDKQNELLIGLTDRKIQHYDLRSNEIIQTYDHHLGGINSITFVNENRNFMTSSDDKTVLVWDFQINAPIRFISDPHQHSMPQIALHPEGKFVAAQSMNNTIVVFGASNRYKRNNKKLFKGHNTAGYSIGLAFSPDGKILGSGDTYGNAYFWDWKTSRLVTKLKLDSKPLSCIDIHPQETSKVAIAGLSGKIHYLE